MDGAGARPGNARNARGSGRPADPECSPTSLPDATRLLTFLQVWRPLLPIREFASV
jgi:hypothetical protein